MTDNTRVPTSIGATVSSPRCQDRPIYVLDYQGWRGLASGSRYEASYIAHILRNGGRVLDEGDVSASAATKENPHD